ncbi:MAG: hypothetical protein HY917_04405, partial [Candidatus Diapherotrites archaeon]|nr:hypothetical protein [Candidatus Diapherotrites archaeon]
MRKEIHEQDIDPNYNRTLEGIRAIHAVDLKEIVGQMIPGKGTLRILDSGAGMVGVSAGLKSHFGNRVWIMALTPFSLSVPRKEGTPDRDFIRKRIPEGVFDKEMQAQ